MLETNHHEKLSDVAVVTLEKLMKNELEEEMNEDVRVVSKPFRKRFLEAWWKVCLLW